MSRDRFLIMLMAVSSVHLVLAASMAPTDDELYYWCWSKQLQASYFDHPPLTAYLIRLSTSMFGDTLLGIRFFACLCSLGMLLLIGELTNRRGVGWLLLTPVFAVGSIVMTPDSPLLFLWSAYAVWLVKMQDRDCPLRSHWLHWVLGGLLLGLGGLSKYTMVLAAPGALLAFLMSGRTPSRSWRTGFALHCLVALAVVSPVLIFNSWHEFIPLRYQLAHASRNGGDTFSATCLFENLGCQFILIGGLPFLMLPWCLSRRQELTEVGRLRVCAWLFLFPSLFFLFKGATNRVEGNWPLICYMTLLPLALHWFDQLREGAWKRWSFPSAFLAPGGFTAVILVHAFIHLPLPTSIDRLSKVQARYETMHRVADWARAERVEKIYTVSYQLTSHLRFQGIDSDQLPGACRPSHFTMQPVPWNQEQVVYLLLPYEEGANITRLPSPDFQIPLLIARFPDWVDGRVVGEYALVRYDRVP